LTQACFLIKFINLGKRQNRYEVKNMLPVEETQTEMITLTPAAVQAVRELLAKRNLKDHALRVFVSGGGCSGLQYGMALEPNIREQDFTVAFDDIQVCVDEVSINYLHGATVDYINTKAGSGFKIENPNAISGCNCGTSYNSEGGGCSGCG
jgi:iron-sulfur cluster assembly accessory protein